MGDVMHSRTAPARSLTLVSLALLAVGLAPRPAAALTSASTDAITVMLGGAAPAGDGAERSDQALARLVRLPRGTTAVDATTLVWRTAVGAEIPLAADAVRISPIMIARGEPLAVVSVPPQAVSALDLEAGRIEVGVTPRMGGAPLALRSGEGETPASHAAVYMIIAADEYVSELDDLVAWKTQAGFQVSLHPISETGSTRDAIRQFVRTAYQTWEEPPLYLLLVGDVDKVPTGDVGGYVSDNIYAAVDGEDFLPDIYVGRFVANTPNDVAVQVAKTVMYESRPDTLAAGGEWFSRALMVAANQGSSTPLPTLHWAADELVKIGYTQVDSCFQGKRVGHIGREEGPPCVKYYVDQGVTLLGYRGWARGDDGWEYPLYDLTHVPLLNNGWKLPVVFSIVCHTGNFGRFGTDCFGEVWMKTGTPQAPRGAVGFIGTAETWSHSRWNDRVAIGIFQSFCENGIHRLGELLADAKTSMLEQFPGEWYMATAPISPEESCEYYAHIYNVLGDPGLAIWTAKPEPLTVEAPTGLMPGQNFATVRVLAQGEETPVGHATVAFSQNGVPIGVDLTGADGYARVPLALSGQEPVTLTVTGENLYPWSAQIPIEETTGYVTCSAAAVGGDGLLPGAATPVMIEATNTGSSSLPLVTGTLIAPAGVTVGGGELSFGTVGAGQVATAASAALVMAAPETENGAQIELRLDAFSSGLPAGASLVRLPVVAPELSVVALADGGDDVFEPGEEAQLILTLHNAGIPAGEMSLILRVTVPDQVTLLDSTATLAAIATGAEGATTPDPFAIRIAGDVAVGTAVPLTLIATHAQGPRSIVPFTLVIGAPDASAPSGPDGYGYYAYDSADIEYPGQAPAYDWIECSTLFGGAGTKLRGIDDNYWSAILPLPFPFRYYGIEVDTVRVDDNGWLAFDTSYWYDIRNWRMPDPWGCASMVAAFWDNLVPVPGNVPNTDGIYYYHDPERHCFVVEWSRLKNWEDTTDDMQTFEILLLDPAHYPTASGDGEIVFQYKQIQNDDWTRMYATVGIEDPTETDGLLYTYANEYAVGASPLSPGLAIKFTTEPPEFQPIGLARFTADWAFRGGAAAGRGTAQGADAAGSGAGVLVRWEFRDGRPLAGFDLCRLPAVAAGQWGEPVKLNEIALAPTSGEFFDQDADPQVTYLYRMSGADRFGRTRTLGEVTFEGSAASGLQLLLPDGNVLGAGGRIVYSTGPAELRDLGVYDLTGRRVRDLAGGTTPGSGGMVVLGWDGRDDRGRALPGGVYWIRLTTTSGDRNARIVVVR